MQPKMPPRGSLPGPSYQPPSAPPVPVQSPGTGANNSARSSGQNPTIEKGLQTSNQFLRTPIVRYSSVMRVGKQHHMRISLMGANSETEPVKPQSLSGGFDPPILVQVTIPGALVTPTHQIIPLSGGDANFVVQPISAGKLKGAKVEFLSQGRKISEIALPIRANKGKLAKWLITLGVLLPFIINLFPELIFRQQITEGNKQLITPRQETDASPKLKADAPQNVSPRKSTDPSKEKSEPKNTPDKKSEKSPTTPPEKAPTKPSAFNRYNNTHEVVLIATLIGLQDPQNKTQDSPAKKDGPAPAPKSRFPQRNNGKIEQAGEAKTDQNLDDKKDAASAQKPSPVTDNTPSTRTLSYLGEDAIWAWVRNKLTVNGYPTKLVSSEEYEDHLSRFLTVNRNYEITGESKKEVSTSRIAAMGLYYLEPLFRLLYRVFIQFPKEVPLSDLGFGLFFIALGVIAWVLTGPNRKKIKGSVMDIRLAS